MNNLILIFIIIQPHEYFFQEFIQNHTDITDYHLQAIKNTSIISNKVLIILILCVSMIFITILLIIYFAKDQIKNIRLRQPGPVFHHFNPIVRLPIPEKDKSKSTNDEGKQHSVTNPSDTTSARFNV